MYDKLTVKENNIDTSAFVLKTKYDTDKSELEKNISDTSGLVKKSDCNTKITELENKIPDVGSLATKTALTAVKNRIPSQPANIGPQDVPRRSPPTSPERPLKILFDRPGDVLI